MVLGEVLGSVWGIALSQVLIFGVQDLLWWRRHREMLMLPWVLSFLAVFVATTVVYLWLGTSGYLG